MPVSRRELLRGLGGFAACTWLPVAQGCGSEGEGRAEGAARTGLGPLFSHGVASGDPLPDSVLLWTRVTPDGPGAVAVRWELAEDEAFTQRIDEGEAQAEAAHDYTVKVDVRGLRPATTYYYRFESGDARSPIGRTRTAPEGAVERLRFAIVSCSNYAYGYFHAYGGVAERTDLDAVVHLGDYLYEYGDGEYGELRTCEPAHEILTLEDYRTRHAQYRSDPNLQRVHQQHPFIAIWDDHEVANNTWIGGAENHNPGEGDFATRKAAAVKAYFEWLPIRQGADGRTFRTLKYGDLADLIMLDTRHWGRTEPVLTAEAPDFTSEARTLLGRDQEAWFAEAMEQSTARWRLIAQQVMVGPFAFYLNLDDWNGYPAARDRLLKLLERHRDKDSIVLTGDVHSSWAMNVLSGDESLAVELVAPAISSPGLDRAAAEALHPMLLTQPHVKYVDLWQRGYVLLDVNAQRALATWCLYPDVSDPEGAQEQVGQTCEVYAGEHRLREYA